MKKVTLIARWQSLAPQWKGLCIGTFLGFIKMFFISSYSFEFLFRFPDQILCHVLALEAGDTCAFFILFGGFVYNPLFFGLIGLLLGLLIYSLKAKHLLVVFLVFFT